MNKNESFHVNHYVGALLAQGGNLWIDGRKVIFSPSSAIDRAMGASDVEIPFDRILNVEFKGDLLRSFIVKTSEKVHKFEGSQAKKAWEALDKAVNGKSTVVEPAPKKAGPGLSCIQCAKSLRPGYVFCPYCGTRIKAVCHSCKHSVEGDWSVCAFCGWKFAA